ncbi:MAG TPA: hypothetical protein VH482_25520 [Thermomicrobiales bacterium]|jgi:hypothetical protein
MPVNRDSVGEHGEWTVMKLLTRRYGRTEPRFRPLFLGAKYPTIDVFVELIGIRGPQTPYFFAQVKATSTGYDGRGRLRVRVSSDKVLRLVRYPAPTYVIGVDEEDERAFIMAAIAGGSTGFPNLPVNYPLDEERTLQALYSEVEAFWRTSSTRFTASQFT